MAAFIALGFFIALTGAITLYGYHRYVRPVRYFARLGGAAPIALPAIDRVTPEEEPGLLVRIIEEVGTQLPISPADAAAVRLDLIAAGYRSNRSVTILFGSKIVVCAAMIVVAFLTRQYQPANTIFRNVILAGAGYAGYIAP